MGIDWPSAVVVVSALITAAIAIVKFVPKRLANGEGERYARAVDVIDMRARIPILEQAFDKESKYMHDSIHAMRNQLATVAMDSALQKQTLDVLDKNVAELLRHARRWRKEEESE